MTSFSHGTSFLVLPISKYSVLYFLPALGHVALWYIDNNKFCHTVQNFVILYHRMLFLSWSNNSKIFSRCNDNWYQMTSAEWQTMQMGICLVWGLQRWCAGRKWRWRYQPPWNATAKTMGDRAAMTTLTANRAVNEYPTMHYFDNPGHTRSMIDIWPYMKLHWKLHCGNVVNMPYYSQQGSLRTQTFAITTTSALDGLAWPLELGQCLSRALIFWHKYVGVKSCSPLYTSWFFSNVFSPLSSLLPPPQKIVKN